jgi:NAD(P)-dependent dehydrogenase (short-subunit alcohol dehydrogenase family)
VNIFITGANRGFGLSFAQQYALRGDTVIAACRTPDRAAQLRKLQQGAPSRVELVTLEVGDEQSIVSCARTVSGLVDSIDILINNAGMGYGKGETRGLDQLGGLTMETQVAVFRVNAIGPLLITQALLPLLRRSHGARVVNISSWLASLGERTPEYDGSFAYSASKTALNMYARTLAFALASDGIIVVPMDPGWARTDMGGESAEQDVDLTVSAMMARIDGLTPAQSGQFILWSGGQTEW